MMVMDIPPKARMPTPIRLAQNIELEQKVEPV